MDARGSRVWIRPMAPTRCRRGISMHRNGGERVLRLTVDFYWTSLVLISRSRICRSRRSRPQALRWA